MSNNKYAVIMAGGVGSRFWPVSKQAFPKQFHDMLGMGKSLLQMTFDRLEQQIPSRQILVLTNEDYVDLVKEQLPNMDFNNIVAEPAMRNTAPCILLAALKIQKMNPEASMIVAPSDHYIAEEDIFNEDLAAAFDFCATPLVFSLLHLIQVMGILNTIRKKNKLKRCLNLEKSQIYKRLRNLSLRVTSYGMQVFLFGM
jgi:mannose-1-phosphate guanylyltransferase